MSTRRKRGRSPALTAAIAAEIKALWESTELTQHAIAARLGINQGRVSEVVNGHLFADVKAAK
jgi:predicted XRE-type DNA-binding protein